MSVTVANSSTKPRIVHRWTSNNNIIAEFSNTSNSSSMITNDNITFTLREKYIYECDQTCDERIFFFSTAEFDASKSINIGCSNGTSGEECDVQVISECIVTTVPCSYYNYYIILLCHC